MASDKGHEESENLPEEFEPLVNGNGFEAADLNKLGVYNKHSVLRRQCCDTSRSIKRLVYC